MASIDKQLLAAFSTSSTEGLDPTSYDKLVARLVALFDIIDVSLNTSVIDEHAIHYNLQTAETRLASGLEYQSVQRNSFQERQNLRLIVMHVKRSSKVNFYRIPSSKLYHTKAQKMKIPI